MTPAEKRAARSAAGLCTCGRTPSPGRKTCETCLERSRAYTKTPAYKALDRARSQTPERKERHRVYRQTPEYKERLSARCQTPEYKERRRAYNQTPERKAWDRERQRKPEFIARRQTPEYKERLRAYQQTPEYKAQHRARHQTPEYKAQQRARRQTPEYRERQRAYEQTPEYKEKKRAYRQTSEYREWARARYHAQCQKPEYRRTLRARKHNRRADIDGLGGVFTDAQFEALCRHFNNRCLCCGREPTPDNPMSRDHVISRAQAKKAGLPYGYFNDIDNIQPLLKFCNSAKNSKVVDYRTNPHPNCRRIGVTV